MWRPSRTVWAAAGSPVPNVPLRDPSVRCALCDEGGGVVAYQDVVSRRFTEFDSWSTASDRLCVACAWSFSQPLTAEPFIVHVSDGDRRLTLAALQRQLCDELGADTAVIAPTRGRKYILPTAQWGHVNGEHASMEWTKVAAQRFSIACRLRSQPGVTAAALRAAAPPIDGFRQATGAQRQFLFEAWDELDPWRKFEAWWPTLAALSRPVTPV